MDLKVGDKVKAIDEQAVCFGQTGTVGCIEPSGHVAVYFDGRGPVHFDRKQLEKIK